MQIEKKLDQTGQKTRYLHYGRKNLIDTTKITLNSLNSVIAKMALLIFSL